MSFKVVAILQIFIFSTIYAYLFSPVPAPCPTDLILLDVMTLITFSEEYKL